MDSVIDLTHNIMSWAEASFWTVSTLHTHNLCKFGTITFVHNQKDRAVAAAVDFSLELFVVRMKKRKKRALLGMKVVYIRCFDTEARKQSLKITGIFRLLASTMLISHIRWQFFAYTPIVNSFDVRLDFVTLCVLGAFVLIYRWVDTLLKSLALWAKEKQRRSVSCKTVFALLFTCKMINRTKYTQPIHRIWNMLGAFCTLQHNKIIFKAIRACAPLHVHLVFIFSVINVKMI